jgi:hypothetical protein
MQPAILPFDRRVSVGKKVPIWNVVIFWWSSLIQDVAFVAGKWTGWQNLLYLTEANGVQGVLFGLQNRTSNALL